MSTYNIEMNYFNGSGYDQLYPRTNMSNISDWNSYVYSKNQVDEDISSLNSTIGSLQSTVSSLNNKVDSITSNFSVSNIGSFRLTTSRTTLFNANNYINNYQMIIGKITSISGTFANKDYFWIGQNSNQTYQSYLIVNGLNYGFVYFSSSDGSFSSTGGLSGSIRYISTSQSGATSQLNYFNYDSNVTGCIESETGTSIVIKFVAISFT